MTWIEVQPLLINALWVFMIGLVLVFCVRRVALRFSIVDVPDHGRKQHAQPTPLLGGIAVIGAVIGGLVIAWPTLVGGYILPKHIIGLIVSGLIIAIGGWCDDRYTLPPRFQIVFPLTAALVIVASGIGIDYISNPFGEALRLDRWSITLFTWNELPYRLTVIADLFTILWLMGTMYTTKFLDGVDGLVSGVTVIGSVILFFLSVSAAVYQPETAHIALIVAAAFAAFLVFNWHPASIFLGESGSLFAGFMLGVVAIVSGAKIATTLLIVGIPVLDVAWVIIQRLVLHRRSPLQADRTHLHLRLLDAGLSQRQVVVLLYALTAAFGLSSLFLHSRAKVVALVALVLITFLLIVGGVFLYRKQHTR